VARDLPPGARGPAVLVLGEGGLALGRRLRRALKGAALHGYAKRVDAGAVDRTFADVGAHLRALFRDGTPVLALCAAGIAIRALAPLIKNKRREPPVVVMDETGRAAAPLLGGHRGANALARAAARAAGGVAAITTAGDARFGLALDDPPRGWRLAKGGAVKPATAALLAGEAVRIEVEPGLDRGIARWLMLGGAPFGRSGRLGLRVSDRRARKSAALTLHPPTLALGVGCERGAAPRELIALAERALARAGLALESVAGVFSIDLKADEEAVHALARRLGVPARFFAPERLERETPRLANPSDLVFRETGCHGVAEGAALAAAGKRGVLVVPKRKSRRATVAVARSPAALDPARLGRARGRLWIVGIGPGGAEWRTPEASAALAEARHVVGYDLYLKLLGSALSGKRLHRGDLGAEEARVRKALDLAAAGADVALVSSGDAGIYALAALAFELLEREDRADWNRARIEVVPGVSSLLLAAARAGAPLGHDFAAVSLSDLLTPWPVIERRLRAAARGDFAVALFNPASARRRRQLARALAILGAARPKDTPVVVARNLGRPGEGVELTTLAKVDPAAVDMLTLLLVGASGTRTIARGARRWVYTPRGYAAKRAKGPRPR
jgi:cobalt-precorrin 5A hydrolase/precorrin-3B C17-methyltransferase